jgi:hypothetical protein
MPSVPKKGYVCSLLRCGKCSPASVGAMGIPAAHGVHRRTGGAVVPVQAMMMKARRF